MKKSTFNAISLALLLFPLGAFAAAKYKDLDNWSVYVDESVNNGCFAIAYYEKGSLFRIGFDATPTDSNDLYFIVGNDDWKSLEAGKKYEISIQFGKKGKWTGSATAFKFESDDENTYLRQYVTNENGAGIDFFQEFMEQRSMRLFYGEKQIDYLTLSGSYAAGKTLIECQKLMNTSNKTNESDPFLKNNKPAKSTNDPFI